MKTILLTTDFSEKSRGVINHAISILGNEMNYILINGYNCNYAKANESEVKFETPMKYSEHRKEETLQLLEKEQAFFKKLNKSITMTFEAFEGIPIRVIEKACTHLKADLVVLGTKSFKPTKDDYFQATTATRLIGDLDIPILVIPYTSEHRKLSRAIYCIDRIDIEGDLIADLNDIFKNHNLDLTLLNILEEGQKQIDSKLAKQFGAFFEAKQVEFTTIESNDVNNSILDFANQNDINLIIVLARKESYMQDFWTGSKVDKLSTRVAQPLLVLPGEN